MRLDTTPLAWQNRGMNETNELPIIPADFDTPDARTYLRAVMNAPFHTIAAELTDTQCCSECDLFPLDYGDHETVRHAMIADFVIIGCQGYYTIRSIADQQ